MLKPQPRFSGTGGHGKRLLEAEEEVFEKGLLQTAKLGLSNAKSSVQAFGGGVKAGLAGMKPKSILPSSQLRTPQLQQTADLGAKYASGAKRNAKPLGYGFGGGLATAGGYSMMNKAYKPSGRLVAASREAELHAFKTAKPRNPKPKQKVWDIGKSVTAGDVRRIDRNARQDKQGKFVRDVGLMTSGASIPMKQTKHWATTLGAGVTMTELGRRRSKNARKDSAATLREIQQRKAPVAKKARTYDSEMNRHRRQGMYVAGGAAGAGVLGASAARDIRGLRQSGESVRTTLDRFLDPEMRLRQQQRVVGPVPNFGQPRGQISHPKGGTVTRGEKEAIESTSRLRSAMSPTMRRKIGGKIGGAIVLGGGSAATYRHSRTAHNKKRWN